MNPENDLNESLREHMMPFWENQLDEFYKQTASKLSDYYQSSQKIWQDDDKFKKMLFTVSGGTLSIFATLGANNTSSILSFGFFVIALSMVCSLVSQIFSPQTQIYSDAKLGLSSIKLDEDKLTEIKKNIDLLKNKGSVMLAENFLKSYKDQLKKDYNKHSSILEPLEKFLKFTKLDVQKISDWQKYLFLLGILIIAMSLVIPKQNANSSNVHLEFDQNFQSGRVKFNH